MDRLRYEGYELPAMSLLQAKQFASELGMRLPPIVDREVNRWYGERVVQLLDWAHFTPPVRLNTFIERMLGSKFSANDSEVPAAQLVHRAFGRARRLKDRALDMGVYLELLPLEHATLALVVARNERLRTEVIGDERFQDCGYATNTPPPEDISESEWIRREALWRAALLPSGDSGMECIRLVLHADGAMEQPDHQAALPGQVTLHERARTIARSLVNQVRFSQLSAMLSPTDAAKQLYHLTGCEAASEPEPAVRLISGILSDHLQEWYKPDGREAELELAELYNPKIRKRLDQALESLPMPEPSSTSLPQPGDEIERYIRQLAGQ